MRPTTLVTLVLSIVALLFAAAPVPSALAVNTHWAWAVSRLTNGYEEYAPLPVDQGNQAGAHKNHVYWLGTGRYRVVFEDGSSGNPGGIVHVTPLGTTSHICNVITWGFIGTDEHADIRCWDRLGHLANTQFVANWVWGLGGGTMGYLWNDSPSASHDITTSYNYNSKDGTNHVAHDSTGHYTVSLGLLGGASGNVQVTAYGGSPGTCRVSYWGAGLSTNQQIGVTCRDVAGHFVDKSFNLTYVDGIGMHGYTTGKYAYFWADKPTTASYLPASSYRSSTSGQGPQVTRTGVGKYTVRLLGINTHGGSVQVTAYGSGKVRCQVSSINTTGSPQKVGVRCFKPNGTLTDSKYSFLFTR